MSTVITYTEEYEVRRVLTDVLGSARANDVMTQLTRSERSESRCSRSTDNSLSADIMDLELQQLEQRMDHKLHMAHFDLKSGLNELRMERYREHIWTILALPLILAVVLVVARGMG